MKLWLRKEAMVLEPHVRKQFTADDMGPILDFFESVPHEKRPEVFEDFQMLLANESGKMWNDIRVDQIARDLRRKWHPHGQKNQADFEELWHQD